MNTGWGRTCVDSRVAASPGPAVVGQRPAGALMEFSRFDRRDYYVLAGRPLRWIAAAATGLLLCGFVLSLVSGSHGITQLGMLHLPAAWLSVLLLIVVAFWSVIGIVTGKKLPFLVAQSVAPTGGMFTFLALWSGALWMRAVEGEWWVGDARQVAECGLLAVYLAMLAWPSVLHRASRADRATAVTALVGGTLVFVLFFAVDGWHRIRGVETPVLLADARLLMPMVLVGAGLWCYATYVGLVRLRCLIKEREFGLSDFLAGR